MAEIKIEKKTPVWPWLVLIAAIIAVLIFIFASSGDDDGTDDRRENRTEQTSQKSTETRQVALNNSTVAAYVSFVKDDPDAMGLDHDFTNEALLKLTNATRAMADEIGYDIQKDLEVVRTHADKITRDPYETTHANSIRKSAEVLANVLQNIQQKAFTELASDADEVKNAATAIEPDVLTLDQKTNVKNFFRQSANLLEKMNNNSPQTQNHVRQQ